MFNTKLGKSLTRQLYRVVDKNSGHKIKWGHLDSIPKKVYLWTPDNLSHPEFYSGGPDLWSSIPMTYKVLVKQGNEGKNDIADLVMVILGLKTNIYSSNCNNFNKGMFN
tara:strand:+ start:364 stop:690 length:327 start_codon:yes stop_codon:yes gene_type:complete